jgi:hypothetical protein
VAKMRTVEKIKISIFKLEVFDEKFQNIG